MYTGLQAHGKYVSGNADRILGLGNNDISILHSRLSAANQKVLDDFAKLAPFDAEGMRLFDERS